MLGEQLPAEGKEQRGIDDLKLEQQRGRGLKIGDPSLRDVWGFE